MSSSPVSDSLITACVEDSRHLQGITTAHFEAGWARFGPIIERVHSRRGLMWLIPTWPSETGSGKANQWLVEIKTHNVLMFAFSRCQNLSGIPQKDSVTVH